MSFTFENVIRLSIICLGTSSAAYMQTHASGKRFCKIAALHIIPTVYFGFEPYSENEKYIISTYWQI
jgi:hypothetical protein